MQRARASFGESWEIRKNHWFDKPLGHNDPGPARCGVQPTHASSYPPVSTFERTAHDVAGDLHKKVQIVSSGDQAELDRTVAERLMDALIHLVRWEQVGSKP